MSENTSKLAFAEGGQSLLGLRLPPTSQHHYSLKLRIRFFNHPLGEIGVTYSLHV